VEGLVVMPTAVVPMATATKKNGYFIYLLFQFTRLCWVFQVLQVLRGLRVLWNGG